MMIYGARLPKENLLAICTDEAFRRAYVLETRQWYMDFSDEIKEAAEKLAKTVPDFTKTDSVSVDK